MQVIESISELRAARRAINGRVGLVPTMGALHAGHLTLVDNARVDNDCVLVTIFVNPTQFAASEDLSKYPRDLERDFAMLKEHGADLTFTPTPDLMYPAGYQTYVEVQHVTRRLEGTVRPEHFRGVATIVAKLFNLTQPDTAYFGQKDAQQVVVIRRMARDLNFPLDFAIIPTGRAADGLALSSRNVYLSPEERQAAPVLYRALQVAGATYAAGERVADKLREIIVDALRREPLAQVDYVSIADTRTLAELDDLDKQPALVSLAARFGNTRLIDNCLLPLQLNDRAGLTETLGALT